MTTEIMFFNHDKFVNVTHYPKRVTIPSKVPITGPFRDQGGLLYWKTMRDVLGTTFYMEVIFFDESNYYGTLKAKDQPEASRYKECLWDSYDAHYFIDQGIFLVPKSMVTELTY
ncbi:hypothetical protein [Lactobacillus xujianguonis]|uniref:hypothetical protein n=1 Tax=Lactobacillus xujianguonis TaxID=2495899 RepID=UPI000FDA23C2|nr:hypothetical protein [Lactobacillus xujianguonis]RVU73626.1 hypothetical protein EJK20_07440 [Lactobacillus xujianguonis]